MDMPGPAAGHRKLEGLAGTWEGEEKMFPSPWDPKGGVAKARMHNGVSLAGFALLGDYEQERDGLITFSGHAVYTYDAKSDRYTLHWFDCLGTAPEVFTGTWKGDTLTLAHGGPRMHARITHQFGKPGELKSTMETSQDGSTWKPMFEGTYRRT